MSGVPAPVHEPSPPGWFRTFWEPWRKFPELRHLPSEEGERLYRAAWRHLLRRRQTWADLAWFVGAYFVVFKILPFIFSTPAVGWLLFYPASSLLLLWLLQWRIERALPACVRSAMGTHCRGCDYDLRATFDGAGRRFDRCPECGLRVRPEASRA
jgi:hypothetical protein